MHQTQSPYKATPLKLLLKTSNEPGVGRVEGCEIFPVTPTLLKTSTMAAYDKTVLLTAQKKVFKPIKQELKLLKELRPYQIEDVLFLTARKNAGCFNEQRTGKTPTSLKSFQLKGLKKILIICPSSMMPTWKDEVERWIGRSSVIVKGTTTRRAKLIAEWTDVLIMSYDCLKFKDYYTKNEDGSKTYSHTLGDIAEILKHKDAEGLIVDEIHRIRNRKTATAEAIFKLSKIPNKLALTGTPALGKQEDIYSTLHFLYPKIFTSYWRFIDYYFTKGTETFWARGRENQKIVIGDLKREQELQEFLNVTSTSRKRKDVMPWLPEKDRQTIRLDLDPKQKEHLDNLHKFFETEHIVTQGILDRLIRERQVCLAPALLSLGGASPKAEWLKEYISDYPEKSIIIFSKFTAWLEYLAEYLKVPYLYTGKIDSQERDNLKKQFQRGKIKILLINIDAGKEGLTLDKADVTIFTDKFPPAGDIEQAEDRFVATTEDKADKEHTIYSLVMKDSYEENIAAGLAQGKSAIEIINDYRKFLKGDE